MFQARQGDLFFEEIKDLPQNVKPKENLILAYGEVTGHMHKLSSSKHIKVFENEEASYFNGIDVTVVHDEHSEIAFPENKWIKVTKQREYDPLSVERERKVAD